MTRARSRSQLIGHPGARIFHAESVRKKKEAQKKEQAYGKCRLYGNPLESADSHRDLEKPAAFPHFPQALLGHILMVKGIHLRSAENWS
jgi:hypothetical protein